MYGLASALSALIQEQFAFLWLGLLALATLYARGRWPSPPARTARVAAPPLSGPDIAALAALAALVLFFGLAIVYRGELADHDHSQLTSAIVSGRGTTVAIWPGSGRFFPLNNQEFDLVRLVSASGTAFLLFAALELVALCGLLLLLLRRFRLPLRAGVVALVLLTPSVFSVFHGLIYPERNLIFFLVLIALGLDWYDRMPSRWAALGTLVATHFALYYKEPVFLIVVGLVATRLAIDWAASPDRPRAGLRRLLATHPLELGMLALTAVFLALYAITMLPHRSMDYAQSYEFRGSALDTLLWFMRADPVVLVFLVTLVLRGVAIARGRVIPDRLWDALAVGAVLYFAAYLALGMQALYYLAPVDVVGLLYVAETARAAVAARKVRPLVPVAVTALLAILIGMSSWYTMIRRKNLVYSRARLAEYVKSVADTSRAPVHLFIPLQTPYALMEFGALLEYKGVSVRQDSLAPTGGQVVIEAPGSFPRGRCVRFSRVGCLAAHAPDLGSLVVIMPDAGRPDGPHATLRPKQPALVLEPFAIPPVMPALRAVRNLLRERREPPRTDWLWSYVEVAKEKADP